MALAAERSGPRLRGEQAAMGFFLGFGISRFATNCAFFQSEQYWKP